ncbi:MAG: response regulator [Candidatus Omnitrophica bacterium]|nr:response regulator [Candidatus Omnitrophota bacterium]
MIHIKWDIKRGADIYRQVFDGRLKSWISTGKIKRGETVVLRSGFSGWRKPEELKELIPYFQRHERAEARKLKTRKQRKEVLVEKNPINPVRNTESSRKENKISNGVKSILIIDDEKDLCLLLGDALRIHGYNVKSVNTKRDAMDSLRMQAPDMVFCDLKLPDGDGMAILTKIRAISPRTIVSMITAYGSKETRDEAKRLGAYGFIDKPFSEEDILENIRDLSKPKRPKTGII